jgi:phospholipase A1
MAVAATGTVMHALERTMRKDDGLGGDQMNLKADGLVCSLLALLVLALPLSAHAVVSAAEIAQCHDLSEREARRACYDRITGYKGSPNASADAPAHVPARNEGAAHAAPTAHASPAVDGTLQAKWLLDRPEPRLTLNQIQPHRSTYVIARKSTSPNRLPASPTPGRTTSSAFDLDEVELKFQLSFKTEFLPPSSFEWASQLGLPPDELSRLRLWLAYTQQSNWQILNSRSSRPFRENNYEPELILTYDNAAKRTSALKLVNIGVAHHSNGRSGAESRSWNKAYVQGGLQFGDLAVLVRRMWRLPEGTRDDNPDIQNYWGRSEILADWQLRDFPDTTVSLLARHNLRSTHRGYAQLGVSTGYKAPGSSRWYVQLGTGYGESLIDYNHRQTVFGVGLSFND